MIAAAVVSTTGCRPAPPWSFDQQTLQGVAGEVDGDRVWDDLVTLTGEHLADTPVDCSVLPARVKYPELCHLSDTRARAWVRQRLESLSLAVHSDEALSENLYTSNIIADLPGTSRPDEIILVGAHFDAYYSGADDNSTGTAALLELARVLGQHRLARTVRFVSFDLEELGLVGSSRYVNTLGQDTVKLALVFDCIGYYSSEPGSQQSLPGLPAPSRGDFLALIANDESSKAVSEANAINEELGLMKTVTLIAPRQGSGPLSGAFQLSDHDAFWLTGRKAVFFSDTAPFRNPNYHKATDTLDTLDRTQLTQAIRLAAASIAYWASASP